ncbi:MAG TPA: FAD binding domain-containing protein [Candidatus Sulfomarinibacteraceae bacterium]|nr:FAD binding domain-containing protein [Candidatus Sulfomarinibacteraceae bacterium]
MTATVSFVVNTARFEFQGPSGRPLLDVIRTDAGLKGTRHACREGDCGSCVVLLGEPGEHGLRYRPVTSCLVPVAAAAGCHVITVEGLDTGGIGPLQQPFVDEGASQCGFCTSGFLVALAGHLLDAPDWRLEPALNALAGNICRCTGYASIRRATAAILERLAGTVNPAEPRLEALARQGYLPAALADAQGLLAGVAAAAPKTASDERPVAGGTDLYVQRPEDLVHGDVRLVRSSRRGIRVEDDHVVLAGSATAEDMKRSPELAELLGDMTGPMDLMGSWPIRERATVAGNIVNASPIGDMTIMLLALAAELELAAGAARRRLALRSLFLGYKTLNLGPGEIVEAVRVRRRPGLRFNFEKVSKRTCLDIASVNSAAAIRVADGAIAEAGLAAGGVAPVPLALVEAEAAIVGRAPSAETARLAARTAASEISPISDVRGSAEYKRLLLHQLVLGHFQRLFGLGAELVEVSA